MFHSTRLKLTAWYLLIIMLVSVTFSLVIYNVLIFEVDRFDQIQRLRITHLIQEQESGIQDFYPPRAYPEPKYDPELVGEVRERILAALLLVNSGILVMSGILSYILAGRTLKPIKDMMDEQNRFISDASHELRTPLTSLKTAFEVYERESKHAPKESETLVNESLGEVNRLITLSSSLLQLAEINSPTAKSGVKSLSLDSILNDVLKMMKPIAKQKDITISAPKTNAQVLGEQFALIELFSILLDNAIKYSPTGKKIKLSTSQTGNSLIISIEDQGVGISEQDLPHIFDRFYRADSARSTGKTVGYGLGLSIAKKIATAHNGSIQVKSTLGIGTIFIIRLPSASLQRASLE